MTTKKKLFLNERYGSYFPVHLMFYISLCVLLFPYSPHSRLLLFPFNHSFKSSSSTASSGCSRQDSFQEVCFFFLFFLCFFKVMRKWFSFFFTGHTARSAFVFRDPDGRLAFKWIVSACGRDDGPTIPPGRKVRNL